MHWRRKWQPTPVFLPGESQGRRNLVGCSQWGLTESDVTEVTSSSSSSVCVYIYIYTHIHVHRVYIIKIPEEKDKENNIYKTVMIENFLKEGHCIVIKRSIYQEDITILSIYALDIGTPKYVQQIQTELKGNINTNTVIFSDFNTELST